MRIGILTQALHGNYGGILQNFALQRILCDMGHSAVTIDRHIYRSESVLKNVIKKILRLTKHCYDSSMLTLSERRIINSNQMEFVNKHIERIGPIFSQTEFDKTVNDEKFDAFIVGSDQCWRPCYSANIANYFLDFAAEKDVKRIAYAASFGVDVWEYTDEQTRLAAKLAKEMDAVSVREASGQKLCKKYLGVDASWVMDPTLLLGKAGFQQFVNHEASSEGFITEYLLEDSDETAALREEAKKQLGVTVCKDNNKSKVFKRLTPLSRYKNISVEEWITNIACAKFVITDSFHGAVFALMFNVPFVVRLNEVRGNARIESLLRDFKLENCICKSSDFKIPAIDWDSVNRHLKQRQAESLEFLEKALEN